MKFNITYISSLNKALLFNAIQYWLPHIGEKIYIDGYRFVVKDIIYNLNRGESSDVNTTIVLDVIS